MKELIEWIIEEIDGGAGPSVLRLKLEMLLTIAEKCPSYYLPEIVNALGGKEDA